MGTGRRSGWMPVSVAQDNLLSRRRSALARGERYRPLNIPQRLNVVRVDVGRAEAAMARVIRRHDALRMEMRWDGAAAWQRPVEQPTFQIRELGRFPDLSAVHDAEDWDQDFDMSEVPRVRGYAASLPDTDLLIFVFDHAVVDGIGVEVALREFAAFYGSPVGQSVPVDSEPLQFNDFIRWEANEFSGQNLLRHLEFWEGLLSGVGLEPHLDLPFVRPPQTRGSLPTMEARLRWGPDETKRVRDSAIAWSATPFIVMFAALKAQLACYGASPTGIAATIANRRPPFLDVVGWLFHNIIVPVHFRRDDELSSVVPRTRDEIFRIRRYEGVPHQVLLRELEPARFGQLRSVPALVLNYLKPSDPVLLDGNLVTAEDLPSRRRDALVIELAIAQTLVSTDLALYFPLGVLEPDVGRMFIEDYVAMVRALVSAPSGRIGDVPLSLAANG